MKLNWPLGSWQPRQLLSRLGIPGVVAVGLLTAGAAFYGSVLLPLDAKIDELRDNVLSLTERAARLASGKGDGALPVAEQLAEFYRLFPQQGQLTDTLGKVFEAARVQGVILQQGEYRLAEEQGGKLRRFQILLPIKADYPRIRRFLASLATEVPSVALEHIQFERQRIGDTQVEATVKLALYVVQRS
jgi:hypothetical protein